MDKPISVENVTFHANDPQQHTVYWSHMTNAWILENPSVGIVRNSDNLFTLLDALSIYSAYHPNGFTITVNP